MDDLRSASYPGITLRPCAEDDREFLYRLFASSRSAPLAALLRLQFRAQEQHYRSAYPNARCQLVLEHGLPIGRICVARLPSELRLVDMTLLPDYRNRGIGSALLRDLMEESRDAAVPIRLHVERGSPARHLYARLGFVDDGDEGPYRRMRRQAAKPGV